jgi:hypothetical protein
MLFEFLLAPEASEERAVVALGLEPNLEDSVPLGCVKSHAKS